MKNKRIFQLVVTAMMAALTCVATMAVRIPSPMNGYVNLGDCMVLLSAWILGPVWGAAAAGIGSMLADILGNYLHYAPGTLIIKSIMVVAACYTAYGMGRWGRKWIGTILGSIVGEVIMVLGYFGYASLLLGRGWAAAASIPGNLVQGAVGAAASVIFVVVLDKIGAMDKINGMVGKSL